MYTSDELLGASFWASGPGISGENGVFPTVTTSLQHSCRGKLNLLPTGARWTGVESAVKLMKKITAAGAKKYEQRAVHEMIKPPKESTPRATAEKIKGCTQTSQEKAPKKARGVGSVGNSMDKIYGGATKSKKRGQKPRVRIPTKNVIAAAEDYGAGSDQKTDIMTQKMHDTAKEDCS